MNKVILMGRLTKDPELRYSQSANPLAIGKYGLAVRRQFAKQGDVDVDFINITAFGKQGEFAEKYFKKGQLVTVVGRLQINTIDDPQKGKQTYVDVIAEEQHFAESKSSAEARGVQVSQPNNTSYNNATPSNNAVGFMPNAPDVSMEEDDDLPF